MQQRHRLLDTWLRPGRLASGCATLVVALSSCTFDPRVAVDDEGRTAVRCDTSASCPEGLRCGAGVCIDAARVRPLVIGEPAVRRPDGTPATRFSREPGFDEARVEVPIEGVATEVALQAGARRIGCRGAGATTFQCDLTFEATDDESLVVQVVARDLRGDEQRRAVALVVDVTPPALIEGGAAAFITAPPGSPLRPPLTPTAVAAGSTLKLQFSLSEAVSTAPRLTFTGTSVTALAGVDANRVFGAELEVPPGLAEVATVDVDAIDVVGNRARLRFPIDFFAAGPLPLLVASTLERVPFGRIDGGAPSLGLTATVPAASGFLAVWESPDAGFPVGLAPLPADGGTLSIALASRDLSRVWTSLVDAAGVPSARRLVRSVTLTVRPTTGFGNPTLPEARPAFIEPLLVEQPVRLDANALSTVDDDEALVESQSLWTPQGTGEAVCSDDVVVADRAAAQGLRFSGFSIAPCDGASLLVQTGLSVERRASSLPFDFPAPFTSWDVTRRRAVSASNAFNRPSSLVTIDREGARVVPSNLDAGVVAGAYDAERDVHVLATTRGEVLELAGDLRGALRLVGRVPMLGRLEALATPSPGGVVVWQRPTDGGVRPTWHVTRSGVAELGALPATVTPAWVPTVGLFAFPAVDGATSFRFVDGGFEPLDAGPLPESRGLGWEEGRGPVLFAGEGQWRVTAEGLEPTDAGVFEGARFPRPAQPLRFTRAGGAQGGEGRVFGTLREASSWFVWSPAGWQALGGNQRFSQVTVATAATKEDGYLVVADAGLFRRALTRDAGLELVTPYQGPMTADQAVATREAIVVLSSSPSQSLSFPLDGGAVRSTSFLSSQPNFIFGACLVEASGAALLGFGNTTGTLWLSPRRLTAAGWAQVPVSWEGLDEPSCSFDGVRGRLLTFGGASRRIITQVDDEGVLREHRLDGGTALASVWAPWGAPAGRTNALFAWEASTGRHLLWGGTTGGAARFDGFSLDTSSVRPGLVVRLPLEPLEVPLGARLTQLRLRAVARGDAPGAPGVEVLGWTAGAWRRPLTADAASTNPTAQRGTVEAKFTRAELLDLDVRSVALGLRSVGSAGSGTAQVAVDALEVTLDYELPADGP